MIGSSKFWIMMAVFLVAFGLAVFAITRHYYIQDANQVSAGEARQPTAEWPDLSEKSDLENSISMFSGQSTADDPITLSNQADEAFSNRQFDRAADLYARLLAADPNNAGTYNNLGITLHYVGRSAEALRVLNEGVALDPSFQRIWLTLGYVNSQLGNLEQARSALTTAVELGADTDVGQSATQMLTSMGGG
jgi:tetratricopeptide (TPR) repeat protein